MKSKKQYIIAGFTIILIIIAIVIAVRNSDFFINQPKAEDEDGASENIEPENEFEDKLEKYILDIAEEDFAAKISTSENEEKYTISVVFCSPYDVSETIGYINKIVGFVEADLAGDNSYIGDRKCRVYLKFGQYDSDIELNSSMTFMNYVESESIPEGFEDANEKLYNLNLNMKYDEECYAQTLFDNVTIVTTSDNQGQYLRDYKVLEHFPNLNYAEIRTGSHDLPRYDKIKQYLPEDCELNLIAGSKIDKMDFSGDELEECLYNVIWAGIYNSEMAVKDISVEISEDTEAEYNNFIVEISINDTKDTDKYRRLLYDIVEGVESVFEVKPDMMDEHYYYQLKIYIDDNEKSCLWFSNYDVNDFEFQLKAYTEKIYMLNGMGKEAYDTWNMITWGRMLDEITSMDLTEYEFNFDAESEEVLLLFGIYPNISKLYVSRDLTEGELSIIKDNIPQGCEIIKMPAQ